MREMKTLKKRMQQIKLHQLLIEKERDIKRREREENRRNVRMLVGVYMSSTLFVHAFFTHPILLF